MCTGALIVITKKYGNWDQKANKPSNVQKNKNKFRQKIRSSNTGITKSSSIVLIWTRYAWHNNTSVASVASVACVASEASSWFFGESFK